MKIDKRKPSHWIILLVSASLLLLALPWRLFKRKGKHKSVVLYGHKLNGNLLPFYEYEQRQNFTSRFQYNFYYLTIDPKYIRTLKSHQRILSGVNLLDLVRLVCADAIITDHGLHHFALLKKLTNIKFIDVWHGIPYKGFDESSFYHLHDYDEIWVSSEEMKQMYIDKFGFKPELVYVTGYARVERLLDYPLNRQEILQKYGLEDKQTILVAPTWQQDDAGRSIIPFGLNLEKFIEPIATVNQDAQVIFRAHLNAKEVHDVKLFDNLRIMPYSEYPVSEDFLSITNVVISDWSSIAFDFLPLDRPMIYLDVPAPFKLGFSLGPEYRFGAVVKSLEELHSCVQVAISRPDEFQNQYVAARQKAIEVAYGSTLDGGVLTRSIERLDNLL